MVFQYRIHAPGSELHGEPFDIQSVTRAEADRRADFHVRDTFSLSSRTDMRAEFVAEYVSRQAMRKAEEMADTLPAPAASEARAVIEDRSDVADEIDYRRERAS